jgi:hypothetical protein
MNMIIRDTTDKQFLGWVIDVDENPLDLGGGVLLFIERVLPLVDGLRLISSSYIIDVTEVHHG